MTAVTRSPHGLQFLEVASIVFSFLNQPDDTHVSHPGCISFLDNYSRRTPGLFSSIGDDWRLEHDATGEASAGIVWVVDLIPTIHVVNVDVIGVEAVYRPRFYESKPIRKPPIAHNSIELDFTVLGCFVKGPVSRFPHESAC